MRIALTAALAALALAGADNRDFTPLFNGKDFSGWTLVGGKGPGYVVEDGKIVCPEDGGGNLLTEREYADFVLRVDFRLTPGGNNGIAIRAPLEGDIAYTGMEIQVLDQDHEKYKGRLKAWQWTGSIYNVVPAKRGDALKPTGEWNTYEITAKGPHVRIILNGIELVDANLDEVTDPEVLKKHPGIRRKSGRIGFLGHNTRVEFRNIYIREL